MTRMKTIDDWARQRCHLAALACSGGQHHLAERYLADAALLLSADTARVISLAPLRLGVPGQPPRSRWRVIT